MDHLKYLGTSYKHRGDDKLGCDCLGLVRWVYREELGIILPDPPAYSEVWNKEDVATLGAYYSQHGFTKVSGVPKEFDVLRIKDSPEFAAHLGVVTVKGYFIHALASGVVCHTYLQGTYQPAISSIYRYARIS